MLNFTAVMKAGPSTTFRPRVRSRGRSRPAWALRLGKFGRLDRAKVTSSYGVLPRVWKIAKGPLPKGVRFDRKLGVLSGVPTKAGRYRVTFQVTDGLKVVATKTLRIDVLPSA